MRVLFYVSKDWDDLEQINLMIRELSRSYPWALTIFHDDRNDRVTETINQACEWWEIPEIMVPENDLVDYISFSTKLMVALVTKNDPHIQKLTTSAYNHVVPVSILFKDEKRTIKTMFSTQKTPLIKRKDS